jgi:hypothetical protein
MAEKKLFICERESGTLGYDNKYDSFVLIATDEQEARALAQKAADEGEFHSAGEFLRGKCTEVTDWKTSRVLLGSFNMG